MYREPCFDPTAEAIREARSRNPRQTTRTGCVGCPSRPRQVLQRVKRDWDWENDRIAADSDAFTGD